MDGATVAGAGASSPTSIWSATPNTTAHSAGTGVGSSRRSSRMKVEEAEKKKTRGPTKTKSASMRSGLKQPKRKTKGKSAAPLDAPLYRLRQILDEKRENGILFFKIDWEDDAQTGEKFEPTWEPAENANPPAIASWEAAKRRREDSGSEGASSVPAESSQSVLPANRRTERRQGKRPWSASFQESSRPSTKAAVASPQVSSPRSSEFNFETRPSTSCGVVVEVPAQPNIDKTQFQPWPASHSSQLSQLEGAQSPYQSQSLAGLLQEDFGLDKGSSKARETQSTIPDSQEDSQVTENQPGLRLLHTGGNHPLVLSAPEELEAASAEHHGQTGLESAKKISADKVIPDSNETSSRILSGPSGQTSHSLENRASISGEIPSRQVEDLELHPEHPTLESRDIVGLADPQSQLLSGSKSSSENPEFLTQPDYNFGIDDLESDPTEAHENFQVRAVSAGIRDEIAAGQGTNISHISESASAPPSHSAQVVQPFTSSNWDQIRIQQSNIRSESDIVPDTLQKPVRNRFQTLTLPSDDLALEASSRRGTINLSHKGPLSEYHIDTHNNEAHDQPDRSPRLGAVNWAALDIEPSSPPPLASIEQAEHVASAVSSPVSSSMDSSEADSSELSAVEQLKRAQAGLWDHRSSSEHPSLDPSGQNLQDGPLVSPSLVFTGIEETTNPLAMSLGIGSSGWPSLAAESSAAGGTTHAIGMTQRAIGIPLEPGSTGLGVSQGHAAIVSQDILASDPEPITIAPADLTTAPACIQGDAGPTRSIEGNLVDKVLPGIEFPGPGVKDPLHQDVLEPRVNNWEAEMLVTLPLAANTRQTYLQVLTENEPTLLSYSDYFVMSQESEPPKDLCAKVHGIFQELLDLCDMPAFFDTLPPLAAEEMKSHAINTNSKFSFVFELLSLIQDLNSTVLLISGAGRVSDFLEAVISSSRFCHGRLGRDDLAMLHTEGLGVILAHDSQDLSSIQGGVDLIIAFDHAARSVEFPPNLVSDNTMILSLAIVNSIEHIGLKMPKEMEVNERMSGIIFGLAENRKYIENPSPSVQEPYQVAELFAAFIKDPSGGLDWDAQELPETTFDFWKSSQANTQSQEESLQTNERKRQLLEGGDQEIAKRRKIVEPSNHISPSAGTHMSDLLKGTLAKFPAGRIQPNETLVEVSLDQIEWMAARIFELESSLKARETIETRLRDSNLSFEKELESVRKTITEVQPKFLEAIEDRGQAQRESEAAKAEVKRLSEHLAERNDQVEELKAQKKKLTSELETAQDKLEHLTIPEVAELTRALRELKEERETISKLEKKMRINEKELDDTRQAYQNESRTALEDRQRANALQEQVEEWQRRASENLIKIHEINNASQVAELNRIREQLQTMLHERERELERLREENRLLKNNRRETRQVSVPRSPRMGMMSPRPGTRIGAPSSRGTSPAPMGQESNGNGNGNGNGHVPHPALFAPTTDKTRWTHLRD